MNKRKNVVLFSNKEGQLDSIPESRNWTLLTTTQTWDVSECLNKQGYTVIIPIIVWLASCFLS